MNNPKPQEISMDYSTMSDFLKCPLRGYYRHILNITPRRIHPALSFGQAFHDAMAVWYKEGDQEKAKLSFAKTWSDYLKEADQEKEDLLMGTSPDDSKRNLENGLSILDGYFSTYPVENWEILSNEMPFKVLLGEVEGVPYYLTGKMDLYVQWGKFKYVVDHKTTSMLGRNYFDNFNPSLQLDGYVYACREIFGECDGAIINAALVAKTKQTFERDTFSKTSEDLELYKREALHIMWWINQMKSADRYFMNTDACTLYGACPFLELCRAKGDERVIRSRYKTHVWDPFAI